MFLEGSWSAFPIRDCVNGELLPGRRADCVDIADTAITRSIECDRPEKLRIEDERQRGKILPVVGQLDASVGQRAQGDLDRRSVARQAHVHSQLRGKIPARRTQYIRLRSIGES